MLALTIVRPMDWAIIHGGKDVENRVWPCPDSVVGKYICVHSGLKWDVDYEQSVRSHVRASMPVVPQFPMTATWTGGRIVGVVRVDRVREPPFRAPMFQDGGVVDDGPPQSPWAMDGQCHWHVSGAIALATPVPARGAQKLWRVPAETEAKIRAQLPTSLVFA